MKRALVLTMVAILGISTIVFAGPFIGGAFSDGLFDLDIGVKGDTFDVYGSLVGLSTQTASFPLAVFSFVGYYDKGGLDAEFGVDFVFVPFNVLPIVFRVDEIVLWGEAVLDAAALFDTNWTVEFSAGLDLAIDQTFVVVPTYVFGFYIEMPWFIAAPIGVE